MADTGIEMFKGVVVCEGEIEELVEYETPELLAAFGAGLSTGAGHYGAGWTGLYTRDDLEELAEMRQGDEGPYEGCAEKIIAYIEANIPE